jgi:hypothetical protein
MPMAALTLSILVLLILTGVFGVGMARFMSRLFKELELSDPELWKELAQPSLSALNPAGSLRASEIMFSGSPELKSHPTLGVHYSSARYWWFLFQGTGLAILVLLILGAFLNAQ